MLSSPRVSFCCRWVTRLFTRSGWWSGCGVSVREVLWVAEADRWICDQLNVSDFPPLHHTRTRRTAPADESLHRCDKYTGLIVARRRNNGQTKMSRSILWSSPDEWDTSVWTLVQQRAVYSRTPLQKRQEVELFSYFSAQFEHLAHWVSPWGLLIWPGLIAP